MKFFRLAFAVMVAITLVTVNSAEAPKPLYEAPKPKSLQEYMTQYATEYNIPVEWLHNIAKCESGYRQSAVGDGGLARGVYQYHLGTWNSFSKSFGQTLDRESYQDQTKLTAWALANGLQNHWTCSYLTGVPRF